MFVSEPTLQNRVLGSVFSIFKNIIACFSGCHVVNMDSHVLTEGRQHIVLGLMWQIIAVKILLI